MCATQNANRRTSVVGFLYDGTTFTKLKDGTNQATYALGINNSGVVVGAVGTLGSTNGFALIKGNYKTILFPGQYVYAFAYGINNLGEIVGFTTPAANQCPSTYKCGYAYKAGKSQNVDVPGALETAALGINDNGVIVGYYDVLGPSYYGFALRNGKYVSFGYPGAKFTFATGINAAGQIVGTYTLDLLTYHGFVTSPITDADFQ